MIPLYVSAIALVLSAVVVIIFSAYQSAEGTPLVIGFWRRAMWWWALIGVMGRVSSWWILKSATPIVDVVTDVS